MNNLKIVGPAMPDMPWEDRPAGSKEVMWRYSANPIIPRDALSTSNSIFNSAVIPFKKGKYNYAGVFRCDDTNRRMRIHAAFSVDGIKWDICEEDFKLVGADPEIAEWVYGYDPRVAKIDDKYYVTWCNGYHGPTIGIAWTDDFETFHQLENAFIPFNRNGVLFPRKINERRGREPERREGRVAEPAQHGLLHRGGREGVARRADHQQAGIHRTDADRRTEQQFRQLHDDRFAPAVGGPCRTEEGDARHFASRGVVRTGDRREQGRRETDHHRSRAVLGVFENSDH